MNDFRALRMLEEVFPEFKGPQVELDWTAYYNEFKQLHGKWPVKYKGRVLFPDGWTYSASELAGPEWPPPTDPEELRKLQLAYWLIRRGMVRDEHHVLKTTVEFLADLQSKKSAPLQHKHFVYNDETGRHSLQSDAVNVAEMRAGRLKWLEDDLVECEERIHQLRMAKAKTA